MSIYMKQVICIPETSAAPSINAS